LKDREQDSCFEVRGSLELMAAMFCYSFPFSRRNCCLTFLRESGAWAEGCISPLSKTWTSIVHDEFDPDDSVVGNNVLRKAFRKPFV
jgi:hypothetical protein